MTAIAATTHLRWGEAMLFRLANGKIIEVHHGPIDPKLATAKKRERETKSTNDRKVTSTQPTQRDDAQKA